MKRLMNTANDGVENCIKALGQSLIDRAEDIAKDVTDVMEITISATLNAETIVSFDVNKTYIARLSIE